MKMKMIGVMGMLALAASCSSELEALKNDLCACKGAQSCIEGLEPRLRKVKQEMDGRNPSAAEEKIVSEMLQCMLGTGDSQ